MRPFVQIRTPHVPALAVHGFVPAHLELHTMVHYSIEQFTVDAEVQFHLLCRGFHGRLPFYMHPYIAGGNDALQSVLSARNCRVAWAASTFRFHPLHQAHIAQNGLTVVCRYHGAGRQYHRAL